MVAGARLRQVRVHFDESCQDARRRSTAPSALSRAPPIGLHCPTLARVLPPSFAARIVRWDREADMALLPETFGMQLHRDRHACIASTSSSPTPICSSARRFF